MLGHTGDQARHSLPRVKPHRGRGIGDPGDETAIRRSCCLSLGKQSDLRLRSQWFSPLLGRSRGNVPRMCPDDLGSTTGAIDRPLARQPLERATAEGLEAETGSADQILNRAGGDHFSGGGQCGDPGSGMDGKPANRVTC